MEIREFSSSDFEGLAGAECFKGGALPLIAEDDTFIFIADKNGLCAVSCDEEGNTQQWILECGFTTQNFARRNLKDLVDFYTKFGFDDCVENYGFEEI